VILDLCSIPQLMGGAPETPDLTAQGLKGAVAGVVQSH
jgi:hypothetical protein